MELVRTDGGRSVRGRLLFGCRFLISWRQHAHVVVNVVRNVVRKQFATFSHVRVWPGRQGRKRPAWEEMIRIDDERETMGEFVVNSFLLI